MQAYETLRGDMAHSMRPREEIKQNTQNHMVLWHNVYKGRPGL